MDFESQRFPVGSFRCPIEITGEHIARWIGVLDGFPKRLEAEVRPLRTEQLGWTYRSGGWTIRQVVHHLADSHMNSLVRFKLALTEDKPTIRPYQEDRFALLPDARSNDLSGSLDILRGVHQRWVHMLRELDPRDFSRSFHHPESDREITLDENTGLYAWHCDHHLQHIRHAVALGGPKTQGSR
ncbi:MAG: putative metal-dependent hydrolase [Planctomycetes bacterium]|nr:putative metal-dependent hydrolase [Planctomycetota bacterium]MCB9910289.1 putative metal-dependent hydrolase [Planctomycetota bacterium]HPF13287.1 putative metal-dependent hydrolase [Planctomycetota bacterium]HRV81437.1 putative metal-dependent hydrolase [Planctomycetota bacterium]